MSFDLLITFFTFSLKSILVAQKERARAACFEKFESPCFLLRWQSAGVDLASRLFR